MERITVNREYKDRLFRLLFGSEKYRHELLDLYNALNGTDDADRETLHLSDAFEVPVEGYEWTATMLNINKGQKSLTLMIPWIVLCHALLQTFTTR